ncbi:MAG: class II aldolase/adducin family protein [Burkholderiaceae bacterium]|nr:class II aldolase/adducin family protein [Sulfuritalea sp.]MCF8174462.1 class II aldolase/adducin family protein [Burkholderiaceae bacterium]MCF8183848.1 class II aldolase/adducin family protein [Polynucleobacter sp.]
MSEYSSSADKVLATARAMNASGINRGSAGNVSARISGGFIITPTGMAYDACTADDMVEVGADGAVSPRAQRLPSSEWRFHRDIYAAKPAAGAVVHTHSPFATALACQELGVPAFHYMVARFGGGDVRCAPYATFGSQELSDAIIGALDDRCACLMAHHGMVVFGRDADQALALAVELEGLCEQYWRVLQLGEAKLLDVAEMDRVIAKFATYGQQGDLPDGQRDVKPAA